MRRYVIKRVINAAFIMWLVATILFFGLRLLPGGPVTAMLGDAPTQAQVESLRAQLGLNEPLPVQYVNWLIDLTRLDMGTSLTSGQPVTGIVASALPKTAFIGILGVLVGLTIAIPTGIVSATNKGELPDHAASIVAFLGLSLPSFFIGIVLMLLFSVRFRILPVFGYTPLSEGVIPWLKALVLPAIAVGLPYAAVVMRMMRSSLLEVLGEQYMKTARAKGLNRHVRFYKHALQNALIPVITVAGIQLAVVIGGSVTVEIVFGIKGMGRVVVQSIINRNYPVTQGAIMVIAAGLILVNLFVDIAYTLIDPRIRYEEEP